MGAIDLGGLSLGELAKLKMLGGAQLASLASEWACCVPYPAGRCPERWNWRVQLPNPESDVRDWPNTKVDELNRLRAAIDKWYTEQAGPLRAVNEALVRGYREAYEKAALEWGALFEEIDRELGRREKVKMPLQKRGRKQSC